jgi:hypothetical protein
LEDSAIMKTIQLPGVIGVELALSADVIRESASREGINVAWHIGRTNADIVYRASWDDGFDVEALTELGELYIEIVLAPLVGKVPT